MEPENEIKKDNPFKVPDGYFETLTDRTMSAISNIGKDKEGNEKKPGRRISLRPFLAFAAAIVGFAVIATVMVRLAKGPGKISKDLINNELYNDLALEEIDTYLIEDELSQSGISENPDLDSSVSSESIIDYLVQEDIDNNDIYELL